MEPWRHVRPIPHAEFGLTQLQLINTGPDQDIHDPSSETTAIQQGQAGEFLVAFELSLRGFSVSMAAPGLPYDLIADDGATSLRVQVKICASPKREDRHVDPTYVWTLKRGRSAGVTQRYHRDDIEVFVLVALDVRKICFQRPGCHGDDVDTKVRLLPFRHRIVDLR
jgi:hypothetical protein